MNHFDNARDHSLLALEALLDASSALVDADLGAASPDDRDALASVLEELAILARDAARCCRVHRGRPRRRQRWHCMPSRRWSG